jgi:6-pyruvoyltetrahydropterin/6-carboxytetrahydropterin synthase
MSFQIATTRGFSASHQLRLYDGALEPLHGHNWVVRVTVGADGLDAIGVVMDFHELERLVDEATAGWHNSHLNEQPAFRSINPSAENVAGVIAGRLRLPRHVRLLAVEVWETPENSARWVPQHEEERGAMSGWWQAMLASMQRAAMAADAPAMGVRRTARATGQGARFQDDGPVRQTG